MLRSREVRLVRRPVGTPQPDDFRVCEVAVRELRPGEVLVGNLILSVDPGQRGFMAGQSSYVAGYELGAPMTGRCLGRVIRSRSRRYAEGAIVYHRFGWREHAVVTDDQVNAVAPIDGVPLSAYLGVLGHPGLTAWVGVREIARVRSGDTVVVSSAAGAVGSVAAQLARVRDGVRVIGIVGTASKAALVRERLRVDDVLDYHVDDLAQALAEAAPEGVSVYFDNVGGAHLDAALAQMAIHGRVVVCGALSTYNQAQPHALRNAPSIVAKRLMLQGLVAYDHEDRFQSLRDEVAPLLVDGTVTALETRYDGLEQAPGAFISLFGHANVGKTLVYLADC